jgi:protein phosphatase
MFEWQLDGKSDVGRVRELNEDCIHTNKDLGFVVLADGMGGHQGGEIASAMAVSGIAQDLEDAASSLEQGNEEEQSQAISNLLESTIAKVNSEIFVTSEANDQYRGMGTTVVVALTHNNKLHYAHVGDSRLYRLRNGELEQLTKDHSLINELLAQGFYKTLEEAEQAGQKNVITRAVGIKNDVDTDVAETEVQENDMYLLCSDGLNDMISDEEIAETLKSNAGMEETLSQLIDKACEAGGRDNVSVMILKAGKRSLIKKSLGWLFKN